MKKITLFIIALITVTGTAFFTSGSKPQTQAKQIVRQGYTPIQGSKEELYQDIFVSLLEPYVNKALDSYYSKYLTELPGSAPYLHNVISVERVQEENQPRRFEFLVELEVMPYLGPHNSVGRDRLTFRINASGDAALEKFQHIESSKILPQLYPGIIKKWPPE